MASLAFGVVAAVAVASPAAAHSFLVGTEPAQGARVAVAPDALLLTFTEQVVLDSVQLDARSAAGEAVSLTPPTADADGLVVRAGLPDSDDDTIYVVAWKATSAVDGHSSAGEFAFVVGDVTGAVPPTTSSSGGDLSSSAWSLMFFAGFALGAGGLVLRWLHAGIAPPWPGRGVVRIGLFMAIAGPFAMWAAEPDASLRTVLLLYGTAQLAALALVADGLSAHPAVPLGALFAAAAAWAGRSHAAGTEGWGALADFVHLAAGATWAGLLVLVAAGLWRRRGDVGRWWPVLRRYAQVALGLVVLLAHAGVASAVAIVPAWSDLWTTGYGQLLLVKVALLLVALTLAAVARWPGLAARRAVVLARATRTEGAVLAAALVVAAALVNAVPPAPASAAASLLGPPPLAQPVARDAGLAGQLNVEVASDGERLDISVRAPSSAPQGTEVEVTAAAPDGHEVELVPRTCGPGCFTQALALADGVTTIRVDAAAPEWVGGTFEAELTWPPGPPGHEALDRVLTVMRAVPELTVIETVTSGPGSNVRDMPITIEGEEFVRLQPYAAGNVEDVQLHDGRQLRLYLPGSRIFTVLELDEQWRIAREHTISPGHDIRRVFDYDRS